MKKKISSIVFLFVFAIASLGTFSVANAQIATPDPFPTFPAGCSSALGYSITTGSPCTGGSTAISAPMPGCVTALGYSITNGAACSGISTAIPYLAGCTSVFGYSTITAAPCNGTLVAQGVVVIPPVVPGLPFTGAGGDAAKNILVLMGSGLVSILGLAYIARRAKIA